LLCGASGPHFPGATSFMLKGAVTVGILVSIHGAHLDYQVLED